MKIAIAALCILGVAAAACAAFLVSGLSMAPAQSHVVQSKTEDNTLVGVLYVSQPLAAMTVIDGGMVISKPVPRSEAPAGFLTSANDVVGKVLAKPLVMGQPFTKDCFQEMTVNTQLSGVIPKGKRAVGISIADYSALDGLMSPGSMVDVMVSFRSDSSAESRLEAIATTLVENVQVLAFEHESVVSSTRSVGTDAGRIGGLRRVTLLVDTKQAKALELAMQQGTLSLALRNPLDATDADKETISVRSLLGSRDSFGLTPAVAAVTDNSGTDWQSMIRDTIKSMHTEGATPPAKPATTEAAAAPAPKDEEEKPHWDVTVIRGDKVETVSFDMSTGKRSVSDINSQLAEKLPFKN